MKKLIAVVTLFFAVAFSANAQEAKKMDAVSAAKLDATKMAEFLGLSEYETTSFVNLFVMKHNAMNDQSIPAEKKKEITQVMDAKIRATLNGDQMQKLESNPELYSQLTGNNQMVKETPKK